MIEGFLIIIGLLLGGTLVLWGLVAVIYLAPLLLGIWLFSLTGGGLGVAILIVALCIEMPWASALASNK